ncbi:MAG: hypothetical protein QOF89_3940 [Acidobacteriota bacterium]|jgi:4-amino-4-deoxy-L-arabinose transferase-like glycosyltransferase|nr:hypothetical protein [Acidobacteriota bacterium]
MGGLNFQSLQDSKPAQSAGLAGALEGGPRYAALLFAVCGFILLFFGGLGTIPLLDPDEGRYAEIPREMLLRGDFVTPRLNGVLYFEKPPLYYWLNAVALAALSRPEIASRLTGAGCGLAGLGLAWLLGLSMGGRRTGLQAAIVLGTTPLYVALARTAIIDMTVTFFLSATLTCFWLAQEKDGDRGARPLWYGAFVSAALATLSKGLIGIVIPGAVVFLFLLFTRRWQVLRRVPWVGGPLLFLAIAVPWHVLAAQRNPDFLWFYFIHEHFLRYATPIADRQQPFWFFGPVVVLGMLPWSGLLPAIVTLFRRCPERLRDCPHLVFLACWAGFVILFFSVSRSKLVPYVLPAFLPLAVLVSLALAEADPTRARAWIRTGATIGALLMGCLWAVGPRVAHDRSAHEVARFLKGRLGPEDEVYSYRFYPQSLPVDLGRLIGVVRYRGELAFGIDHLPPEVRAHRFPTAEQFRDRWRSSPRPIYLVLESSDLGHMEGDRLAPGPIVFRQSRFLLMTNQRFPNERKPL